MQAVVVHEAGGPEALRYETVPVPEPGEGQARIRIAAAGLNFIDVYHRTGLYKLRLPAVLGSEAAGTVDAIGPGVTGLQPGDRVAYAMQPGAYAEYSVVPAHRLVPVPDGIDLREAAAVMLQGMTAHYLTHSTFPLRPGQVALIHAAAGGAGQLLVQLAKRRGARVIATTSTEEKARLALEAGADSTVLYAAPGWEAEVKRLAGGDGVDVVYDSVGRDTFEGSLSCLRARGMLVLFGQSSGPVPPVEPGTLARGSFYLTRPGLAHYTADREELLWRAGDLFEWMAARELRVRIDRTFPLSEAAEAHRYLQNRQTKGKVLLIPG